jgi:hypothetical protein
MGLKDVKLIDPVFRIPEGAEDEFEYTDGRVAEEQFDDVDDSELTGAGLATPDTFIIISQTIRRGTGKQQLVDVIFETDDIAGATKYEISITPTSAGVEL